MGIKETLATLPNFVEIELSELTVEELNDLTENKYEYKHDTTLNFRMDVVDCGFKILKLIAVYYQGWECDEWAAIVVKDDIKYRASTDHGSLRFEEIL